MSRDRWVHCDQPLFEPKPEGLLTVSAASCRAGESAIETFARLPLALSEVEPAALTLQMAMNQNQCQEAMDFRKIGERQRLQRWMQQALP